MEEISGQNSVLGLEDLDWVEAKSQAENTKWATAWGIKKNWEMVRQTKADSWLQLRNTGWAKWITAEIQCWS